MSFSLSRVPHGMRRRSPCALLLAVGISLAASVNACSEPPPPSTAVRSTVVTPSPSPSVETRARTFIGELARGEWDHPKTPFSAAMVAAAPGEELKAIWGALEKEHGRFEAITKTRVETQNGIAIAFVECRFARGSSTIRVPFGESHEVAGFFLEQVSEPWTPPAYVDTSAFEEHDVTVGSSPSLPGTISVPKGAGPFPAVVLVHGSGPNDRDESVGGVKPFKDLAWGLASNGIVVLRYVKRSRHAPAGIVTQKEEVLDAAHDAIESLKHTPGVDPKRVFLLGHSQGGYLAPRIVQANPSLAGAVILAGSAQPLQDSIVEQLEYFVSLDGANASLREMLDAARKFKARVESSELRADDVVDLPLGGKVTGAYFLDVRGYDPPALAEKLSCRLLLLQGERDYQVTMRDFDRWKKALASKKTATFHTYPAINHLFVSGTGQPSPKEYERTGNVDAKVIADIAEWIGQAARTKR